ncbi:unnamed protein product [Phytomonas sp. Hart1]|nr:unnamed protein product [Phytomonas sp. Hart1]|eukprot:CCW70434.1 unnamed protein product [Phytomonas sp. isolate Hart1]
MLADIEALAVRPEGEDATPAAGPPAPPASSSSASAVRGRTYAGLLSRLHQHARGHLCEVANAFRAILIEAERAFFRKRRLGLSRPLLLCLFTIAKLFPMTDYRHAVGTPFLIFLSSALMQMRLENLEGVHSYVGLNAILIESLRDGNGKFAAEAVVAAFNLLALQLPRRVLEPTKHQGLKLPILLVERGEDALLGDFHPQTPKSKDESAENGELRNRWRMLETHHDAENLVLCAYHQLDVLVDLYRGMAAFPAIFDAPFKALEDLLRQHHPAFNPTSSSSSLEDEKWEAIRRAHAAISAKIKEYCVNAEAHRTPLALRTFRVRPIRQFEPLLAEREENAVKSEIREIKHEIREDKKRVIRHLTAEATVERRAREKEHEIAETQRERRYNQVMGQLQAQQHIMKTVDAIMARGKARPKKGISGAPNPPAGGEGDGA